MSDVSLLPTHGRAVLTDRSEKNDGVSARRLMYIFCGSEREVSPPQSFERSKFSGGLMSYVS